MFGRLIKGLKSAGRAIANSWYNDVSQDRQMSEVWNNGSYTQMEQVPSRAEKAEGSELLNYLLSQSNEAPTSEIESIPTLEIKVEKAEIPVQSSFESLSLEEKDILYGLNTNRFDSDFGLDMDKVKIYQNLRSLTSRIDDYVADSGNSKSLNYLAFQLEEKAKTIREGIIVAKNIPNYAYRDLNIDSQIAEKFYKVAKVLRSRSVSKNDSYSLVNEAEVAVA